jgi:hypothetical protein
VREVIDMAALMFEPNSTTYWTDNATWAWFSVGRSPPDGAGFSHTRGRGVGVLALDAGAWQPPLDARVSAAAARVAATTQCASNATSSAALLAAANARRAANAGRPVAAAAAAGANGSDALAAAWAAFDAQHAASRLPHVTWMAATNDTLVELLQQYASVTSPAPLLVLLTTNVSLCYAPFGALPRGGLCIKRPVVFVGSPTVATGVNFCMQANQVG